MSLLAKIAERVVAPVVNGTQGMLISGNPNLISPAPNLISPAPAAAAFLPIAVFIGLAAAAGVGVAIWRHNRSKLQV
jgi:hypothetical protein